MKQGEYKPFFRGKDRCTAKDRRARKIIEKRRYTFTKKAAK